MSITVFIWVVVAILLLGTVLTILVGVSKENREENPEYDKNSVSNWRRLSIMYAIGTLVFFAVMFWFMR